MGYLSILLSPFSLLFLIMILGLIIGNIQVKRIEIGTSGVLFIAILTGYLINRFMPFSFIDSIADLQNIMRIVSTLGTSFFVSVIGLQTGFSLKGKGVRSLIAASIGSAMSMAGLMSMQLIATIDKSITKASLIGILCGALTNTPALSCVCEFAEANSKDAAWGYSCAYPFGVIIAILFARLFSHNTKKKTGNQTSNFYINNKIHPELILICISAFLGMFVGEIPIPFINISLGHTTGLLFTSLCVGVSVNKTKIQVSEQILNVFKSAGLSLFLAGTGFVSGTQIIQFDIRPLIYGIIISIIAIMCGMLLCKLISKNQQIYNTSLT